MRLFHLGRRGPPRRMLDSTRFPVDMRIGSANCCCIIFKNGPFRAEFAYDCERQVEQDSSSRGRSLSFSMIRSCAKSFASVAERHSTNCTSKNLCVIRRTSISYGRRRAPLDYVRDILTPSLGNPRFDQSEVAPKFGFRTEAEDGSGLIRLTIEINKRERAAYGRDRLLWRISALHLSLMRMALVRGLSLEATRREIGPYFIDELVRVFRARGGPRR